MGPSVDLCGGREQLRLYLFGALLHSVAFVCSPFSKQKIGKGIKVVEIVNKLTPGVIEAQGELL